MQQVSLIPSGFQFWHRNCLAASHDGSRFVYASTLALYVHNHKREERDFSLQSLVCASEQSITSVDSSPVNSDLLLIGSKENSIAKFSIEKHAAVNVLKLKSTPVQAVWNPCDPSTCAVLCSNGTVYLWTGVDDCKDGEKQQGSGSLTVLRGVNNGCCLRWNPKARGDCDGVLAVGHRDGTVSISDLSLHCVTTIVPYISKDEEAKEKAFHSTQSSHDPTQPSRRSHNTACSDDMVFAGAPAAVVDVQWDPLSGVYMLVTYANGRVAVLDSTKGGAGVMQRFKPTHHGVSAACFLTDRPGIFATGNSVTPVLTLWNVSQAEPVGMVRVPGSNTGILSVLPVPGGTDGSSLVLGMNDGSVQVFDLAQQSVLHSTAPGHTETVFDCEFDPSDPYTLATCSYDGSVKLWDVRGTQCKLTISPDATALYSVSWNPAADAEGKAVRRQLAAADRDGYVTIYDAERGTTVSRHRFHQDAVFGVRWHPADPTLIACSGGREVAVFSPCTGKLAQSYRTTKPVFGCGWSHHGAGKALLSAGCGNGEVLVFDPNKPGGKPVAVLKGHTSRAFNTVWSPLLPDTLASGSDDRTIRVWNWKTGDSTVLRGHIHNVRALCFSHEVPWLLISGSWDGQVRMWDIRSGCCLHTAYDHSADVYGIASHPERPFIYASCSRDTSVRFWSLENALVRGLMLSSLANEGCLPVGSFGTVAEAMEDTSGAVLLAGAASARVRESQKARSEQIAVARQSSAPDALPPLQLAQFRELYAFISAVDGVGELFDLAESLITDRACPASNRTQHLNDIRAMTSDKAREWEQAASAHDMGALAQYGHVEQRLRTARDLFLKTGNIRKYCELSVQLGEWETALSLSPGVSLRYWKSLGARYVRHLSQSGSPKQLAVSLAAGNAQAALSYLSQSGDLQTAMSVAASHAVGELPMVPDLGDPEDENETNSSAGTSAGASEKPVEHTRAGSSRRSHHRRRSGGSTGPRSSRRGNELKADTTAVENKAPPVKERAMVPVTDEVRAVTAQHMNAHLHACQPVHAANQLLAIGDAQGAVRLLAQSAQHGLAFVLCDVFHLPYCDHIFLRLAEQANGLGIHPESLAFINRVAEDFDGSVCGDACGGSGESGGGAALSGKALLLTLFAARFPGRSIHQKNSHYLSFGLRSVQSFAEEAKEMLARSVPPQVTLPYLVAGEVYNKALQVGLGEVEVLMKKPVWGLDALERLVNPLMSIPLAALQPTSFLPVLLHAFYLSALRTQTLGYSELVSFMWRVVRVLVVKTNAVKDGSSGGSSGGKSKQNDNYPYSLGMLWLQEASYFVNVDAARAVAIAKAVLSDQALMQGTSGKVKQSLTSISKLGDVESSGRGRGGAHSSANGQLQGAGNGERKGSDKGGAAATTSMHPFASQLPSARRRVYAFKSVVAGQSIDGLCVVLESRRHSPNPTSSLFASSSDKESKSTTASTSSSNGRKSSGPSDYSLVLDPKQDPLFATGTSLHLSLREASILAEVAPFSPLLTGERLDVSNVV